MSSLPPLQLAAPAWRRSRSHHAALLDALLWLGIYLALVAAPLFALLPGSSSRGHGFGWDFAMALGYSALAMLGIQFALTARFRRATSPFGIDIVYFFHRYLAVLALAVACLHAGWILAGYPAAAGDWRPADAPAHMTAGRLSLLLFAVVVVSSLVRRRLGIDYDLWRRAHVVLATTAFALALAHLFGSAHYLDTGWKHGLWVAYGAFWLALVIRVRAVRPWLLQRRPWRVAEVRPERGRVSTLVLEPVPGAGHPPLAFSAGQFAWLTLRASPFAMREHPFSIASSAERPERIELSIKALGDMTETIPSVSAGETVWLDAPYGTFSIDPYPDAPGHVFVAGGIGIAPVLSMLRTLADRADGRPLLLLYANRAWDDVAFREELDALAQRLALRVVHVLEQPPAGWTGEQGWITRELLTRYLPGSVVDRSSREYFICGPQALAEGVQRSLATLGVPAARVHSELFEWV